jgi:dethiobiotin synthetase
LLIKAFSKHNIRVGVCKPIETGVVDTPLDATLLLNKTKELNPLFEDIDDITAYTFPLPSAPFCADTQNSIKIEKILSTIEKLSKRCDILLIEGAGGLLVPITQNYTMVDLAKTLKAPLLLVTPSRLGCINDTMLSIEALKSREVEFEWCINLYEDKESFERVTKPYYDAIYPSWWSVESGVDDFVKRFLNGYR